MAFLKIPSLLVIPILLLHSALSFVPTVDSRSVQTKKPWGVSNTALPESADDSNFDDVPLARLLGLDRMKRKLRKFKRESNADGADSTVAVADATPSTKSIPRIIIAGAPASGKGTQCEMITKNYGLVHLSTGDMLRAAVADKTEVGVLAKEYMDAGKLVPDEVIIGVVCHFILCPSYITSFFNLNYSNDSYHVFFTSQMKIIIFSYVTLNNFKCL